MRLLEEAINCYGDITVGRSPRLTTETSTTGEVDPEAEGIP